MKLPDLAQCKTASASKGARLVHNSITIQCNNITTKKSKKWNLGCIQYQKRTFPRALKKAKSNEPRRKNDPDPAKNANLMQNQQKM